MKNHWLMKFLAFALAVCSGALAVLGAAGVVLSEETGFVESRQTAHADSGVYVLADMSARYLAADYAWRETGMSEAFFREYIYWDYPAALPGEFDFDYRLMDGSYRTLVNTLGDSSEYVWEQEQSIWIPEIVCVEMPVLDWYPDYDEYTMYAAGEEDYGDAFAGFPALSYGTYSYAYGLQDGRLYRIDFVDSDRRIRVEICLTAEQYEAVAPEVVQETSPVAQLLRARSLQEHCLFLGVALVLLALSLAWLCVMAGKCPGSDEIRPGGLNMLPIDLYAVGAAVGAVLLAVFAVEFVLSAVWVDQENVWIWMLVMIADGAALGLLSAMFLMAVAAQFKTGGGYWWRKSLCGQLFIWINRCGRWGKKACRRAGAALGRGFATLPTSWKWVVTLGGTGLVLLATLYMGVLRYSYIRWNGFFTLLFAIELLTVFGALLYCVYAFAVLKKGAADLAAGDLHRQVPEEYLRGPFRDFAGELNCLSGVVRDAAREQLKSERMRSELITNVSHDIKTPLTSIINYVDLLQRTEDPAQRQQYLEVLERQSQQLKKLIEDLMEMSKASTGNLAVDLGQNDVTELVHQAIGEFSDRLDSRNLQVIFHAPQSRMALCDGRLLWRVLSNVLSNVVKYSLPGTRVYLDVNERAERVEVSVKNISAQALNISADELMERFVRGDASRNTEGNGLGLNIARSLMEAQGGTLELVVDGDLFKVVLTLPMCS